MVPAPGECLLLTLARRRRQSLILFLHALGVMLEAGYDLAYAWPETYHQLREASGDRHALELRKGESLPVLLQRLADSYPDRSHRLWFALLGELYRSGTSLSPAITAIGQALEEEQERDWQAHTRSLPVKASLVLALFFLIPALALVFLPLLTELGRAF